MDMANCILEYSTDKISIFSIRRRKFICFRLLFCIYNEVVCNRSVKPGNRRDAGSLQTVAVQTVCKPFWTKTGLNSLAEIQSKFESVHDFSNRFGPVCI